MLNLVPILGEISNYLKRETGNPSLELAWLPDEPRVNKRFRFNKDDNGKGCFAIVMWVRQRVDAEIDGRTHTRSEWIPYATPLDGNHGNPLVPGRWMVDMFLESDKCTRGHARVQEVEDHREGKVIRELKERDEMAKMYATDTLLYNAMKRYAEDVGTEMPTREEMIALEKRAIEQGQEMEDRDQQSRRQARMHYGKNHEDML